MKSKWPGQNASIILKIASAQTGTWPRLFSRQPTLSMHFQPLNITGFFEAAWAQLNTLVLKNPLHVILP
jgi:hypothetical protein